MSYTIQYWHETAMEWRGTGSGSFSDKSHARQRMHKLAEMCDHCVRFRVEDTRCILTPEEREWLTQEEDALA